MSEPGLLCVADWARYPWLRAGFSTRLCGGSEAYGAAELNLGWTAEDDPAKVAANRAALVEAVAPGFELVTVRQVHGDVVHLVEAPLATPEGKAVLCGDGLMTSRAGLLLGVQTADCVPVLLADTRLRAVAAFHAGWRGTLAGIVEKGVAAMQQEFGSRVEDLTAAVGPAIALCCFEVGDEVRSGFRERFAYAETLISGRHLDLHEANRRQLVGAGMSAERVTVLAECTVCARVDGGRRKYFSYRAEKGVTGRMLSVIGAG